MLELLLDLDLSLQSLFHLRCLQRQLVDFLDGDGDVGRFVDCELYHPIGAFPQAFLVKDEVCEGHFGQQLLALDHLGSLELAQLDERRGLLYFADLVGVELLDRAH